MIDHDVTQINLSSVLDTRSTPFQLIGSSDVRYLLRSSIPLKFLNRYEQSGTIPPPWRRENDYTGMPPPRRGNTDNLAAPPWKRNVVESQSPPPWKRGGVETKH